MNRLDEMLLMAKLRMQRFGEKIREFYTGEDGVSNIVATVILVLIVVLLIAVFWGRLKDWLETMMNTIFGTEFDDSGLTKPGP